MEVRNFMLPLDDFPVVDERQIVKKVLEDMGRKRLGIACVISEENQLTGIFTDGDLRRHLLRIQKPFAAFLVDDISAHASRNPTFIEAEATLESAVDLMEEKKIWDLPVVSEGSRLVGLLHLHPVVKALLQTGGKKTGDD